MSLRSRTRRKAERCRRTRAAADRLRAELAADLASVLASPHVEILTRDASGRPKRFRVFGETVYRVTAKGGAL